MKNKLQLLAMVLSLVISAGAGTAAAESAPPGNVPGNVPRGAGGSEATAGSAAAAPPGSPPAAAAPSTVSDEKLAGAVNDALSLAVQGDLKELLNNIYQTDRERINKEAAADAELKRAADSFDASWKAKFKKPFADGFSQAKLPYSAIMAAGNQAAAVVLQGENPASAVSVTLFAEAAESKGWVLDVPDTMNAAELVEALTEALRSPELPADRTAAYHAVALRVLGALSGPQPAMPAPAQAAGAMSTSNP